MLSGAYGTFCLVYNLVGKMVMTVVTITEAKARLTQLLREVEELGEQILITRSGRPAGVLLSADEYEGLLETLEILADPDLSRAVRQGLRQAEAADLLSEEEVWGDLDAAL